ncbi:MAG: O-antigen ligase family protein, partial [Bacteroidia bacterium]
IIWKNKFALLFIAFYIMHLIGLLYTQNMGAGLFDVQVKLSILVFPLILASRPIEKEKLKMIFFAFVAGGILSSLIMLSRAIYTYEVYGENNFFYQAFSFLIHPSYLSMYFNFCIAWLLINMLNKSFQNKFSNLFSTLIIIFFSFIIVLLSSKLGLIALVLVYIGFLIYFIISRKQYLIGIGGLLLIFISVYSLIAFVPAVGDRVHNAMQALTNSSGKQTDVESTAVRLLVWKAANQIISENFLLGVGTGDAKDVLMQEYERRGMTGAIDHKLNTHNEFYQVFVSIGLIGFILLLANLFFPLIYAFKMQDSLYIVFLLILILNFLPESMFETQAGVMFYAFFNSLLCFSNKKTA